MLTAFVFTRQGAPFLADVNMKAGSTIFYLIGIFFIYLTLIASPRPMFESETELFTKHAHRFHPHSETAIFNPLPQPAFSLVKMDAFSWEIAKNTHRCADFQSSARAHPNHKCREALHCA